VREASEEVGPRFLESDMEYRNDIPSSVFLSRKLRDPAWEKLTLRLRAHCVARCAVAS
jgi:hypothetical protein